ncbi:hypothetical protein OHB04_02205 [Streptomyces sp. NBC_01775]|uniref:hypothetical protein n=1 Tax=Streptomyces sp. NBC_01775 TaxID=2975939 RepID=UPI002DDA23B9|nr:hypothetical protein [Streptomyces sp. NBC_01775]WSB74705.1 hypothetical protein OHB04_02205 [Streptomyces sp. NBC_01775]
MRRTLATAAAGALAAAVALAPQASAATVQTSGSGWKLTSQIGVYAASPSTTYTITFETAAMKTRYAPYYTEALKQINAAGLHITVGGVEPVDINKCGPKNHIQVTERYRPVGTPGWSKGVPCPYQPKGLGVGGLVIYDSEYWDGSWPITQVHLKNTIPHEILHALGLDHPNTDLDKDGVIEPHECVATSYGNKPIMCSPNGGYSTSNAGKLVGYDVNGVKALIANARAQGIS